MIEEAMNKEIVKEFTEACISSGKCVMGIIELTAKEEAEIEMIVYTYSDKKAMKKILRLIDNKK